MSCPQSRPGTEHPFPSHRALQQSVHGPMLRAVGHYRAVFTCHCQVRFRWGVLDLRWLAGDCSWLFFLCPAQNDLSVPLLEEDLDGSSGLLFPVYDSDTHMLYVVGKVSVFHISKCRPVWFCSQPVLWQTEVKDAPEPCQPKDMSRWDGARGCFYTTFTDVPCLLWRGTQLGPNLPIKEFEGKYLVHCWSCVASWDQEFFSDCYAEQQSLADVDFLCL